MKFTLLPFLLFSFLFSSAQNPLLKKWDKRFGGTYYETLSALIQTSDVGFVLGGNSESSIGGDKTQQHWGGGDYWIVKTDSLGNKLWDKRFGGTSQELFRSLQQTTEGGYILGGSSVSGISGDKTEDCWNGTSFFYLSSDYWVVKIDSSGNKQWDKRFGGNAADFLSSLVQTKDGGYILGGSSSSDSSGNKTEAAIGDMDYWIIKIDSSGNKQWDKTYGGTNKDEFASIMQTKDGGYLLGGTSYSDMGGDKSQPNKDSTLLTTDYWVVKIDSIGNKQWDKCFGGLSYELLNSLLQTTDDGYFLAGASLSGISGDKTEPMIDTCINPGADFWLVKIDSSGNKQWDKKYGGLSKEDEFGNITKTKDGAYLLAGTSYSSQSGDKSENNLGNEQSWIVKISAFGTKLWDKTIFTLATLDDEIGYAVQTKDGCYAIANWTYAGIGGYKSQASRGDADFWLIKFCDTSQCNPLSVSISVNGNILTAYNAVTYQWHFNDIPINGATNATYIATKTGNYAVEIGDSNGCNSVSNNVYIAVSGIRNLNASFISLSPNPFTSTLSISLQKENLQQADLTITDVMGSLVFKSAIQNSQFEINLSYLPAGVYFLQVTANGERSVRQLVKQ